MSTTIDGRSDGHGSVFMGLYVRLLVRYLRLYGACLLSSLRNAGIGIAHDARPVLLDPDQHPPRHADAIRSADPRLCVPSNIRSAPR